MPRLLRDMLEQQENLIMGVVPFFGFEVLVLWFGFHLLLL